LIQLHDLPAIRRSHLQIAVIDALGKLGGNEAEVLELLDSDSLHAKSARVRLAALRAVANLEIDAETAQTIYLPALSDENVNVRVAACLLLMEHGRPEEIVMDIAKLLEDCSYFVRILAAHSLAGLGPHAIEAIPSLTSAMQDRNNVHPLNLLEVIPDAEMSEEMEYVDWSLFDGKLQTLNRKSVHSAVRSALAAIRSQTGSVNTAFLAEPIN
jgi:HEAT repeat protein